MTTMLPPPYDGRPGSPAPATDPRVRPAEDHSPTAADRALLADRYTAESGAVQLTGIQALVRMVRDRALADRARGLATSSFISGYEGSPLGGYDLELARRAPLFGDLDVVHQPAVNEELGATAVSGSQLAAASGTLREGVDGVVGYWYGKAPGLDRSIDALRHANLAGTSPTGGAVAIVGDDPFAKSSTVPSSSERVLADLGMPILVPADSGEALKLGIHAAWMSRASGLWTALRVTAAVADGNSTVQLAGPPSAPAPPTGGHTPSAHLLGPNLHALEASRVGERLDRAKRYARDRGFNRITRGDGPAEVGIVCAGAPALAVEETLRGLGDPDGVRVLRLGMTWPLEEDQLAAFAEGLRGVAVIDEKGDFLTESVRAGLYGAKHRPPITTVADAATQLREWLQDRGIGLADDSPVAIPTATGPRRSLPLAVANRTPHFCSGCPHNASTRVTGDSLVGGGIGCHAMVLLMDPARVGDVTGTTQMGGEGAQWIGMGPFVTERHLVQNLGDGTFFHSGSLAIRSLVAAGANVTVKLLHNGTVAMTGGQDPVGQQDLAGIVGLLRAEGVGRIVVTTDDVARTRGALPRGARRGPNGVEIRDRADLADVQRELAAESGVTVLIHDQSCAAENRRARKRGKAATPTTRVVINERICEGCGDCGEKSGCLSVQPVDTPFGRKTRIDQSTCNYDYSCLNGDCPAFTTVEVTGGAGDGASGGAAAAPTRPLPDLADADLPVPDGVPRRDGSWGVRITGVGGTGVVMLAAVIATAARRDGKFVRGVDMTGLAQKGGAVVSDLRIADSPLAEPGVVPAGRGDLLLALDGLTAADPANLKVIDAGRTTALVSSTSTPTGVMCTDVTADRPDGVALADAIGSRAHRAITTDAAAVARSLFGDSTFQTTLMLGAAVQAGALPVTAESVEAALRANGVAVAENIRAFRYGRLLVARPEELGRIVAERTGVTAAPSAGPSASEPAAPTAPYWALALVRGTLPVPASPGAAVRTDLVGDVAMRAGELAEWGSRADAERFIDDVAAIAAAERAADPHSTELTRTAAFGLHKLTAYKDEYEVARLTLDDAHKRTITDAYGPDATERILLHPPMLRALGMEKKIGLRAGPVGKRAMQGLARMKSLRGTPLDPFGRTAMRRMERELAARYRGRLLADARALRDAAARADGTAPALLGDAIAFANLADGVRGYEEVKVRSSARLREELGMGDAG